MNTQHSNSQFNHNLLKIILTLLITLTAVQFITPITTYADEVNSKGYNGTSADEGATVGSLYWGGSTERTALLFYIVNNDTKEILTASKLGVTGSGHMGVVVYNSNLDSDGNSRARYFVPASNKLWGVDIEYWTHFGGIKVDAFYPVEDLPDPVYYNEVTCQWSGNNEAVVNWFFTEDAYGDKNWEILVEECFGYAAVQALKDPNSDLEYTLCIEPVSTQFVYGNDTWTESGAQSWLSHISKDASGNYTGLDSDYAEYLETYKAQNGTYAGACKPYTLDYGVILRNTSTGKNAAKENAEYTGLQNGGANWKWTNQAMPYCMTLAHEQLGISPVNDAYPSRKAASVFASNTNGYGLSMFSDELQVDYINSYDITTNPTSPAPAEPPTDTDEKDTTGDVTIVKLYYDLEIELATGECNYTFNSLHKRTGVIGNVTIHNESSVTGYTPKRWAATVKAQDFSGLTYQEAYRKIATAAIWNNGGGNVSISEQGEGSYASRKYVYILYTKTTTIPAPEIEEYDFEIPESYITKQVYFSQANNTSNTNPTAQKLIQQEFEWVAEAHNNCPGHEVLSCTTPEHTHPTTTLYTAGLLDSPYRCLFFTHF